VGARESSLYSLSAWGKVAKAFSILGLKLGAELMLSAANLFVARGAESGENEVGGTVWDFLRTGPDYLAILARKAAKSARLRGATPRRLF
jgi:hypothetical protein